MVPSCRWSNRYIGLPVSGTYRSLGSSNNGPTLDFPLKISGSDLSNMKVEDVERGASGKTCVPI